MSKTDILAELPALGMADRREIFERICELEEHDLINGYQPDAAEKALLDRAIEDYDRNPQGGASWETVERRMLQK